MATKTTQTIGNWLAPVVVLAWVWGPGLRRIFKYPDNPILMTVLSLVFLAWVVWQMHSGRARRWVEALHPLLWTYGSWILAVMVMAASAAFYPLADGLKIHGGGSDADDAVMLGSAAILQGLNPYVLTTYLGNPFSPGPGWLALLSPLGLLYPLLTGLMLLVVSIVLTRRGQIRDANTFAVLMCGCLLVWEMAVTGNDLSGWGMAMVLVLLVPMRGGWESALGLGLVLGCLTTARIAFLYVPVLYAFAYGSDLGWKAWLRGRHMLVAGVALVSALLWHWFYMVWTRGPYPPMHLVGRAQGYAHGWVAAVVGLALLGTGGWMLANWRKARPEVHMALGFGVPMMMLSFMDLASVGGSLGSWEGATYMMPALPLVLLAYVKTRGTAR